MPGSSKYLHLNNTYIKILPLHVLCNCSSFYKSIFRLWQYQSCSNTSNNNYTHLKIKLTCITYSTSLTGVDLDSN